MNTKFQVGDLVKFGNSGAFVYRILMITPNGTLYCKTRLDNVPCYFPPDIQHLLVKVEEDEHSHS